MNVKCENLKISVKNFNPEIENPTIREYGEALDTFLDGITQIYSAVKSSNKLKKLDISSFSLSNATIIKLSLFNELQELVI